MRRRRAVGLPSPAVSLEGENEARAQFLTGQETRQLFARDTRDPDGPLYFLADGEASAVRALCKAGHLVCPDEECEHREFTTVGASRKRHHFRHVVSGSGHGLEGYFHVVGKHLLAEWARAAVPGTTTVIEAGITTVNRRADALATTPDGRRYALEVQYAALDFASWEARDEDYRAAGIVPIWVFGHLTPHLVAGRGSATEPGEVRISTLHEQILEAGRGPILFLDPNRRELAQLLTHWDAVAIRTVESDMPLPHLTHNGILGVSALEDCALTPEGLATPWAARLEAGRENLCREAIVRQERARKAREREAAAAAALAAADARARAEADAAAANRRAARLDREQRTRAALVARVRHAVAQARARVRNTEDPALAAPGPVLGGIPAWSWRLPLYVAAFHGRTGSDVFASNVLKHARQLLYGLEGRADGPVTEWLFELRSIGLVDFADYDGRIVGTMRVLGDVDEPPPVDVAQPRSAMEVLPDGSRFLALDRGRGAIFEIDRRTGAATGSRCDLAVLAADRPCPPEGTVAAAAWSALRRRERRNRAPAWVTERLVTDARVAGDPDWHVAIWEQHVAGRAGATCDFNAMLRSMAELGCGRSVFAEEALLGFLAHLRRHGALRFSSEHSRPQAMKVLAVPGQGAAPRQPPASWSLAAWVQATAG